jgi:hypothetical protein
MNNVRQRFLFWLVFVAFLFSMGWVVRYHFFGIGYFRPVIVTESRILYLGTVPTDTLAVVEFSVTNAGWRSLQIESIRSGCAGCVEIIAFPKEPVRRNETVSVRVALNTKSLKGSVRKSFVIISNDPVRSVYPMLIDAVVLRENNTSENGQ